VYGNGGGTTGNIEPRPEVDRSRLNENGFSLDETWMARFGYKTRALEIQDKTNQI
jgi:hypothetical protein